MSLDRINLIRLDLPLDQAEFDRIISADPLIASALQPIGGDDAATWKLMEAAHVYQVSSARDELPRQWFVEAPLLERCPNLLAASVYGAGYDTVDVAACTKAGVCVVNQAGGNAGAVAEHAIGMMLGLAKRIGESDRKLRRGESFGRSEMMGRDLDGMTVGLIGIGHTGGRAARLAKAFGMTVIASDPFVDPAEISRRGAEAVSFDELLERADVISVHCPLDDTTRNLFDAKAFAAMKPRALFVATSRGGIYDEPALYEALKSGHIAGAGLDVWKVEPPPADHPLLSLDNVIASAHGAGVTTGARRQMASLAASQIVHIAHGGRPPRLINPEVWPAYARRFEKIVGRRVSQD